LHLNSSLVYHLEGITSTIPESNYTSLLQSQHVSLKTVPYEHSTLKLII